MNFIYWLIIGGKGNIGIRKYKEGLKNKTKHNIF